MKFSLYTAKCKPSSEIPPAARNHPVTRQSGQGFRSMKYPSQKEMGKNKQEEEKNCQFVFHIYPIHPGHGKVLNLFCVRFQPQESLCREEETPGKRYSSLPDREENTASPASVQLLGSSSPTWRGTGFWLPRPLESRKGTNLPTELQHQLDISVNPPYSVVVQML